MSLQNRSSELTGTLNYIKGVTKALYCMFNGTLGHDSVSTSNVGLANGLVDVKSVEQFKWSVDYTNSWRYRSMFTTLDTIPNSFQQSGWNAEIE